MKIAKNEGKKFEEDFANSVDKTKCWLYRLRDNAASFSGGDKTRFSSTNICDYILYHNDTRTLYLCELKSTKSTSIPYTMLKQNQINGLTEASNHLIVPCFIFNYREYNNVTYFMLIDDFNDMKTSLKKKSFNPTDLEKYGALKIYSEKKQTRYRYDIERLIKETHL